MLREGADCNTNVTIYKTKLLAKTTRQKLLNKLLFLSSALNETIINGHGGVIWAFREKLESFAIINCVVRYTWQVSRSCVCAHACTHTHFIELRSKLTKQLQVIRNGILTHFNQCPAISHMTSVVQQCSTAIMCITRFDLVRHILSMTLKNAVHITMRLPATRVPVGVVSICSSKFIFSYLYWSARRQGLWSWQSGLSDLGVDQQPIWAQGPGWIYIAGCASMLGFPIRSLILEASGEWDTVFFFVVVVFVITKIMRLAITSINAWFSGYINEFSVESFLLSFVCLFLRLCHNSSMLSCK